MDRSEIVDQVRMSLSAVLNQDVAQLHEDTRLFEELGLDSTSVIELLMHLEDTVGLQVDPDDLEPEVFQTIGTLADYVLSGTPDNVAV
jgi:acyl carrier protein